MNEPAPVPSNTQMAAERTWLAHERTLMAWVRTSASMISFGFTIYKFFEFESGSNAHVNWGFLSPRHFALILVSIGLIALLLATFAHKSQTKDLVAQLPHRRRSMAEVVAALISGFGLLVFMATWLRS